MQRLSHKRPQIRRGLTCSLREALAAMGASPDRALPNMEPVGAGERLATSLAKLMPVSAHTNSHGIHRLDRN